MKTKSKRKKKQKYTPWIILIGILALLGLLAYGGTVGWFQFNIIQTWFDDSKIPTPGQQFQTNENYWLQLNIQPKSICAGDYFTGTLMSNMPDAMCRIFIHLGDGWKSLADVQLNSFGSFTQTQRVLESGQAKFAAVCCDSEFNCKQSNEDLLTVNICDSSPPTPYVPQEGDVVGGGTGSGSISDGTNNHIFDLSSVQNTENGCRLGAKIYTQWDYKNQDYWQECYTLGGYAQGVKWSFKDSRARGTAWYKEDEYPQTNVVDLCPLQYDGNKNWELIVEPLYVIPNCEINYNYKVEIYFCDCD